MTSLTLRGSVVSKLIVACGTGQLFLLLALSRVDARVDTSWFLCLLAGVALAYVSSVYLISRDPPTSRKYLLLCLLFAVIWRVMLVGGAPLASDDVYRYIWDGRVQQHGYNPYTSVPNDPALDSLHTELTRAIDPSSAVLPTVYPAAAELFFWVVTSVHESVSAMVIAVVLFDVLSIVVLWRWLVSMRRNVWLVLVYAWHPLVAVEGAGGGHIDVVGTLFVLSAAYALYTRHTLAASVSLAVAFSLKFLPIVLAPLLWRRIKIRDALLASGLVFLFYLPFMDSLLIPPVGSLPVYVAQWRFNGPVFAWFASMVGVVGSVAIAVGGGVAVAIFARLRLPREAPEAWAWPMATTLLLLPAVYPWYLVWLTPFLTSSRTWLLMSWTLGVLLTYVVWISQSTGAGWVLPVWVEPVEYGLLAGSVLFGWCVSRRRELDSSMRQRTSHTP